MDLTESQKKEIMESTSRIAEIFDKYKGFDAIEKQCNLSQRIRIKWWSKSMVEFNRYYWNIILMMAFYNVGNNIQVSHDGVKAVTKATDVSSVLAHEGYDFNIVRELYQLNGKL